MYLKRRILKSYDEKDDRMELINVVEDITAKSLEYDAEFDD